MSFEANPSANEEQKCLFIQIIFIRICALGVRDFGNSVTSTIKLPATSLSPEIFKAM